MKIYSTWKKKGIIFFHLTLSRKSNLKICQMYVYINLINFQLDIHKLLKEDYSTYENI